MDKIRLIGRPRIKIPPKKSLCLPLPALWLARLAT